MPNWCFNRVVLTHENVEAVDEFEKHLVKNKGEDIFQYLRPRPEDQDPNWYDWNVQNWGTKWDTSVDWKRDGDEIHLSFESAWSPPISLFEYLEQDRWTIDAQYIEEGMGYVGEYTEGADNTYEYDITDVDSINSLPENLIELGDLRTRHEEWVEENKDETEVD